MHWYCVAPATVFTSPLNHAAILDRDFQVTVNFS
jgi:hypothetical protein